MTKTTLPAPSKVQGFLAKVKASTPAVQAASAAPATGPARLIVAMDATASREPSWRVAREVMDAMFREVPDGLAIQLVWYGGDNFHRSTWATDARALLDMAARVRCEAGNTQIVRTLGHAVDEAARGGRVAGLVLVGDAFEEDPEKAQTAARRLRLLGCPVFAFQEGHNPSATNAFKSVANVTNSAHLPFDGEAPERLRDLLAGIAAYAQGGLKALEAATKRLPGATLLLTHLKRDDSSQA